jgi:hypothetical protein
MYCTHNSVFLNLWVTTQIWVAKLFWAGNETVSLIYLLLTRYFDKIIKSSIIL